METRRLGRTGHRSTVAIFGTAALADARPQQAEEALATVLAAGVNHLDVAPSYGRAEELLGPLLPPVRDRMFVACKTHRANPSGVRAQLEESLRRLGCTRFDLYQLHGVTSLADLDRRAGAAEAILAARSEGLTRFAGITSHDLHAPDVCLEALGRYDLDTVMLPVNPRLWADADYRASAERLLAAAAERDVGVMAIKAVAARPWAQGARHATTWYEPYTAAADIARGVRFALSVPGVAAVCTPGDLTLLPRALAAAAHATPMPAEERARAATAVASEPHIFPMPT